MAEMLETAKNGSLKTPIMHKVNLSFRQLDEYLSFLVEIGLVEIGNKEERTFYKTTSKGLNFVKGYKDIMCLLAGGDSIPLRFAPPNW